MSEKAEKLKVDESRLPGVTVWSTKADGVVFVSRKSRLPAFANCDEFLRVCPHCDRADWALASAEMDWPDECLSALKIHRGLVPLSRCSVHGHTIFVGEGHCREYEPMHCKLVPL